MKKFILLTIAILVILSVIFFQIKPAIYKNQELTKYEKIDIDMNSGENVYTYGNNIYIYGKSGIKIYENTKETFFEEFSMEDAYATFSEDKIAISDRKGKSLKIYGSKGILYSVNNSMPIISSTVNKNGFSAIISKNSSFYEIIVFDNMGNNVFTLSNITYKEGIPINIALANDNSALAVSFLKIDSAIMETNIGIYSLNQDDTEHNSVFGAFKKINQMTGIIKFLNNDNLLILSEEEFSVISVRAKYKDAKEIIKVPLKNKINFISFLGGSGFALGYGQPYSFNEENNVENNTIVVYNYNGSKVGEIKAEKNITNIFANENGIIFCEGRLFKGYSTNTGKIFEYQAIQDIKSMQFFSSKEKAFIVTEDNIKIFKINKKNITNLEEKPSKDKDENENLEKETSEPISEENTQNEKNTTNKENKKDDKQEKENKEDKEKKTEQTTNKEANDKQPKN